MWGKTTEYRGKTNVFLIARYTEKAKLYHSKLLHFFGAGFHFVVICLPELADKRILHALIDVDVELLAELLRTAAHGCLLVIIDGGVVADGLETDRIEVARDRLHERFLAVAIGRVCGEASFTESLLDGTETGSAWQAGFLQRLIVRVGAIDTITAIDYRGDPVTCLVLEIDALLVDDLLSAWREFVPYQLFQRVHDGQLIFVEGCAAFALAVAASAFAGIQVAAECFAEHVFAHQCIANVNHLRMNNEELIINNVAAKIRQLWYITK